MKLLESLEQEICAWPQVTVSPHRFGGREFRFRSAEIGHIHAGGILDVPLPRTIRDALLEEGLAEEHHWVPDSGWITFRIRAESDLHHALWLMRLSYSRYLLKTAANPHQTLEELSRDLDLNPRLRSLLEAFLPVSASRIAPGPAR
jgi:hypothetical protein